MLRLLCILCAPLHEHTLPVTQARQKRLPRFNGMKAYDHAKDHLERLSRGVCQHQLVNQEDCNVNCLFCDPIPGLASLSKGHFGLGHVQWTRNETGLVRPMKSSRHLFKDILHSTGWS